MECTLYDDQRIHLIEKGILIRLFEFMALMHGKEDLLYEDNWQAFDALQKYLAKFSLMSYFILVPFGSVA